MSEHNYNFHRDLHEVKKMAEALNYYVRQAQLYYNIGSDLPTMTLGGFVMRVRRLQYLMKDDLTDKQVATLNEVQDKHHKVLQEWHYHYTVKLISEINSRLDVMSRYITDCNENPARCHDYYRPEALRRTIIEDLLGVTTHLEIKEKTTLQKRTKEIDGHLRPLLEKTEFLWDDNLQAIYPERDYWWLYRKPIKEKVKST